LTALGITGHRGLTDDLAAAVAEQLRNALTEFDPAELSGVSCIADGADALFARVVLDRGGRLEVVVPAAEYREKLPVEHHPVYDELYAQASRVHQLKYTESTPEAHMAASRLLISLTDELIAVWDGQPSRSYGGTADVVDDARAQGVPVRVVWPEGATRP
jgi:hypothetical protein